MSYNKRIRVIKHKSVHCLKDILKIRLNIFGVCVIIQTNETYKQVYSFLILSKLWTAEFVRFAVMTHITFNFVLL